MSSQGYAKFTDDEEEEEKEKEREEQGGSNPPPPASSRTEGGDQDIQHETDIHLDTGEETSHREQEVVAPGGADGGGDTGGGDGGGDDDGPSRWSLSAFYRLMMSNAMLLYTSQALSAWGDRMWSFAVSLYLVEIEDQSLRLTAVYGLCVSASALVFGAAVGKWVDKTPRLRAARTSLIIQNSTVIINACILCTVLLLKDDIVPIWNGGLYVMCQIMIITLGTVASLASLAEKICIQKDWVVVVAGNDKEVLAHLNANMRRIDLVVNIVAPIAVGAIMTASMLIGGIFIAAWNAGSMVIEYWNLHRVYRNVPGLAVKGGREFTDESLQEAADPTQYTQMEDIASIKAGSAEAQPESPVASPLRAADGEEEFVEIPVTPPQPATPSTSSSSGGGCRGCCGKFTEKLKEMFEGWKVYRSYEEFWAGLGLAFLYMTVLGFDSITNGYGYSQGVPEWVIGISQAFGSIAGIVGTVLFPIMRKRIGVVRSGIYSLFIEITFLTLCLGSIWAPGSPFIYDYSADASPTSGVTESQNASVTPPSVSQMFANVATTPAPEDSSTQCKYTGTEEQKTSYVSIGMFYAGIVLSRIGLWSYDLVTTQLIQEHVKEMERGVFNGVQRAMECSFDMIHFILVIILPCPETFGYLIVLSVIFIVTGAGNYLVYSYKKRGHLIHPEKVVPCLRNGHV